MTPAIVRALPSSVHDAHHSTAARLSPTIGSLNLQVTASSAVKLACR